MIPKKPFKKGFGFSGAPYYTAAAGGVTFSLTWQSSAVEAAGGTTVTYSSLAFGAADTNRIIAVVIAARMTTVNTISSVTIGGISATLVSGTVAQLSATTSNSAIYQAAVPTGTTGNVVVTYGAATARTGVSVYRIITATPTASSASSTVNSSLVVLSATITVPVGGGGIAGIWESSSTTAFTWSNATSDTLLTAGGSSLFSTATATGTGSVTLGSSPTALTNSIESAAAWGA